MTWRSGLLAGAFLLAGCDMRTDNEIILGMRVHIRERCNQGLYPLPEGIAGGLQLNYCSCIVDRLTEGKSRSDIIEMEENAALYMEPGETIVRQCTGRANAQAEEARRIECAQPGRSC